MAVQGTALVTGPHGLIGRQPWREIVAGHGLRETEVAEAVSWPAADFMFNVGWDVHSSTVKIRQAGFGECLDTRGAVGGALLRCRLIIKMI